MCLGGGHRACDRDLGGLAASTSYTPVSPALLTKLKRGDDSFTLSFH